MTTVAFGMRCMGIRRVGFFRMRFFSMSLFCVAFLCVGSRCMDFLTMGSCRVVCMASVAWASWLVASSCPPELKPITIMTKPTNVSAVAKSLAFLVNTNMVVGI